MPIPESQLEIWSHQGPTGTASSTYHSIQNALAADTSPVRGRNYEVYLQGSYRNDTNIRGDSDVDTVVQLNETYLYDITALSSYEQSLVRQNISVPTYQWDHFRRDVLTALRDYYGPSEIKQGDKSLKVALGHARLPCDVVVCLKYLKYMSFSERMEGIAFYTQGDHREIINFPKLHYQYGVDKNSLWSTNGWFKPTVRLFKNIRTFLEEQKRIPSKLAPSYLVESLIYNAPSSAFGSSYQETLYCVLKWLETTDFHSMLFQHQQSQLIGNSDQQWSLAAAMQFRNAAISLWNDW